jgi:hypothetical protein
VCVFFSSTQLVLLSTEELENQDLGGERGPRIRKKLINDIPSNEIPQPVCRSMVGIDFGDKLRNQLGGD